MCCLPLKLHPFWLQITCFVSWILTIICTHVYHWGQLCLHPWYTVQEGFHYVCPQQTCTSGNLCSVSKLLLFTFNVNMYVVLCDHDIHCWWAFSIDITAACLHCACAKQKESLCVQMFCCLWNVTLQRKSWRQCVCLCSVTLDRYLNGLDVSYSSGMAESHLEGTLSLYELVLEKCD